MFDLDALLNSYKDVVDAHLSTEPLLDAQTYSSAELRNKQNYAGDIYVGCIGKWLLAKDALKLSELTRSRAHLDATSAIVLTAREFSTQMLQGKLFISDIAQEFQPFVTAYVRDTPGYSQDYMNTNVVAKLRTDMSEVGDDEETYQQTAAVIQERYAKYVSGNQEWLSAESHYQEVTLTDGERNPGGWLVAFERSAQRDSLPEKFRRIELNRFWALVDFAPEIASRAVVNRLLSTFVKSADSSIQQSVLNALAAMPFDMVMSEILEVAPALEEHGWLADVLSCWGGAFTKEQLTVLPELLEKATFEQRNCVYRVAKLPDYRRESWALDIQQL